MDNATRTQKGGLLGNLFQGSFWNSRITSANVRGKELWLGYVLGPFGMMLLQSIVNSYFIHPAHRPAGLRGAGGGTVSDRYPAHPRRGGEEAGFPGGGRDGGAPHRDGAWGPQPGADPGRRARAGRTCQRGPHQRGKRRHRRLHRRGGRLRRRGHPDRWAKSFTFLYARRERRAAHPVPSTDGVSDP